MRLALAFGLLALGFPAAAQDPGSDLTGVVRLKREFKPRKLNAQIDATLKHGFPSREEKDVFDEDVVVGPDSELANVLVRVKDAKPAAAAPDKTFAIDTVGYFFKPRVVALQAGQKLQLKNSSRNICNFHGKSKVNQEFNVGIGRGHSHDVLMEKPETGIQVSHDCTPWMIAWVHVIDHPWFAVTGPDGTFTLKGLPAGKHRLEAWHEKFGTKTFEVTLDGKNAKSWEIAFE
jgi:hypothetical protein